MNRTDRIFVGWIFLIMTIFILFMFNWFIGLLPLALGWVLIFSKD